VDPGKGLDELRLHRGPELPIFHQAGIGAPIDLTLDEGHQHEAASDGCRIALEM
jgi:hypothetical protein